MRVPRRVIPPPQKKSRPSLRALFTLAMTTTMVATGGFGAFPENALTQTFQEVISENVSADFLQPFNSYMENISAPTITSKLKTNTDQPDLIDILTGNESGESDSSGTATAIPVTITLNVPTATNTATSTQTSTPTATITPTATSTFTLTNTLTPTASTTPTYLPLWTKTPKPTKPEAAEPEVTNTPQATNPCEPYPSCNQ